MLSHFNEKSAVVAEIKMSRAAFPGVHLLLEGESDSLFWRTRCKDDSCAIVICDGKITAVKSIEILEKSAIPKILGIIDDDLDSIFGKNSTSQNIISTDSHDLETMLLESPALEKCLEELVGKKNIDRVEMNLHGTFRSALIDRAIFCGMLRYLSQKYNYNFNFKKLPWRYIDSESWVLDEVALLLEFSQAAGKSSDDIKYALQSLPSAPVWTIIHGHDAMDIFMIALLSLFKTKTSYNELGRLLRLAFLEEFLEKNVSLKRYIFMGTAQWYADYAKI